MSSIELKPKAGLLPISLPETNGTPTPALDLPTTSFVLKNAPQHLKPTEPVACMNCPLAVWMLLETTVQCHCRTLHMTVWDTHKPGKIRMCDAPEQVRQEAAASS